MKLERRMPVMEWRLSARDKQKYLCAQRLGVMDKLTQGGWAALSAADAGRIGGSLHGKRKNTH